MCFTIFVYFGQPSITLLISYLPAGFPARYFAASTAPLPNTALEYAVCLNSITSSGPAKITSCSPTIEPPRTAAEKVRDPAKNHSFLTAKKIKIAKSATEEKRLLIQ